MLLSEFIHAVKIIPCPGKKIWNKCEQSNTSGEILNAGDNVDDEEMFGFSESYFKTAPTNIDEYIFLRLNLQQENMRTQRNIEINGKIPDKKHHNNKMNNKKSDDRDQIRTIGKKKIIEDEETVQLQNLSMDI